MVKYKGKKYNILQHSVSGNYITLHIKNKKSGEEHIVSFEDVILI